MIFSNKGQAKSYELKKVLNSNMCNYHLKHNLGTYFLTCQGFQGKIWNLTYFCLTYLMVSDSKLLDFELLDYSKLFSQRSGLPGGLEFIQKVHLYSMSLSLCLSVSVSISLCLSLCLSPSVSLCLSNSF